MTDYALNRLSPREFEHLVQALATKLIGPGIVVFGDGPDGGREATFDRKIPFPSIVDPWDGYGVIQAKFLQRPKGAPEDGNWAITQLSDELQKYVDTGRDLPQPEYFIFATNAVLTPFHKRGSKDRLLTLLEEFKTKSRLKDYRVWDYDQICTFLDADADVRKAYAGFVTPGDVLAEIIGETNAYPSDMESTLVTFLQKELLSDEFVNLEQAGHDVEERIPLARVFVDLPTLDESAAYRVQYEDGFDPPSHESQIQNAKDKGFIKEILAASSERLDPASSGIHAMEQGLEPTVPQEVRGRFVLIGGPGQGKTTLGQFVCQIFRASIISQRPSQTLSAETRKALSIISTHCEREGMNDAVVPRFPFRLILNDFASALSDSSPNQVHSVYAYLARQITKRTEKPITADALLQFLAHYPSVIIFDGLDEVPASSNRDQVLNAINDFWIDASNCNADILSIATSRPQGYNEDFSPRYYRHLQLAELSKDLGLHYAERLVDVRYGTDTDRKDKILNRLKRAFENESTARLMRSPLQVTIMTALVDRMGQPPQARWDLFKSYYDVIYLREVERNIPASAILRDHLPDITAIHNQVGLLLQMDSEQRGRTDARLSRQRFISLVEARLKEEGHDGESLHRLAQQIVEAAAQRLVFLVELEEDQIGFEIRSLQEFMAAESLMEGSDLAIQSRLEEIAPIQFWRNVFLFAAGKCFSERQSLRETIHTICAELNELGSDAIAAAFLSGSDLASDLLYEGLSRHQPKYARMFARIAVRHLDVANPELQVQLARVYEPQLEAVYRDEIGRRISAGSGISFLGAWNCLLHLVQNRIHWAIQFANDNWPTDIDVQSNIFQASSEPMNNLWAAGKLAQLIPGTPFEHLRRKLRSTLMSKPYDTHGLEPVLEAALEVLTPNQRISNNYVEITGSGIMYGPLVRLNGRESTNIRHLQNIETWHPSWTVYKFVGAFLDAPSKEGLATVLVSLAESFGSELEIPSGRQYETLPWPVSACLEICDADSDLVRLAERAMNGELGDVGDWIAAEKRWFEGGITRGDLMSMTDDRMPFDAEIKETGFPTGLSILSPVALLKRPTGALETLLDVFDSIPTGSTRSFVANAINWTLMVEAWRTTLGNRTSTPSMGLDKLKSIYREVPVGSTIPVEVLIREMGGSIRDTSEFFADLASKGSEFKFAFEQRTPSRETAQTLHEVYLRLGRDPAFLQVLATAAEHGVLAGQHVALPPEAPESARDRLAVLIIDLVQASWDADCIDRWISSVQEAEALVGGAYGRIISVLENNPASGCYADKFIAALGKSIPSDDYAAHRSHVNLMGDVLGKRTSKFTNGTTDNKFDLPNGIVRSLST